MANNLKLHLDVGGTGVDYELCDLQTGRVIREGTVATADFDHPVGLLELIAEDSGAKELAKAVEVAMPGQEHDGVWLASNVCPMSEALFQEGGWRFDAVSFVNDQSAKAAGSIHYEAPEESIIVPKRIEAAGKLNQVVVSVGTGLNIGTAEFLTAPDGKPFVNILVSEYGQVLSHELSPHWGLPDAPRYRIEEMFCGDGIKRYFGCNEGIDHRRYGYELAQVLCDIAFTLLPGSIVLDGGVIHGMQSDLKSQKPTSQQTDLMRGLIEGYCAIRRGHNEESTAAINIIPQSTQLVFGPSEQSLAMLGLRAISKAKLAGGITVGGKPLVRSPVCSGAKLAAETSYGAFDPGI